MIVTKEIPEGKKKSVPDDVNGNGYDDTKNTSTGIGAGVNGYDSVYGTGNIVFHEAAQENNAYQQWLKNQGVDIQGDYAQTVAQAQQQYAQALAQNKAAYERQLGTYGAKAENLAQSGLSASGYSDYLAGQAYAQQQAANVQAGQWLSSQEQSALQSAQKTAQEQYANYLSQVNKQTEDIYSSLQSTGGKLSDEAKKYYETLGYSPEAITKAETLYSQYQATPEYKESQAKGAQSALLSGQTLADVTDSYNTDAVNQARADISKITDKAAQGVTKQSILAQLGYDATSMSEEAQNLAYQKALGLSSNNTGRETFVNNQIEVAKRQKSNDDAISDLQSIANVLVKWSDEGVSKQDIQSLANKVLEQFDLSGINELLDISSNFDTERQDRNPKIKYTYGNKTYTEYWHTTPSGQPSLKIQRELNVLPSNQTIANIDGKIYVRADSMTGWVSVDGLDKRSKSVLSTIAKLQRAGATVA